MALARDPLPEFAFQPRRVPTKTTTVVAGSLS